MHRLYHARCVCIAFLLALFVLVCAFAHIVNFSCNNHCVVIYEIVLQCGDTFQLSPGTEFSFTLSMGPFS